MPLWTSAVVRVQGCACAQNVQKQQFQHAHLLLLLCFALSTLQCSFTSHDPPSASHFAASYMRSPSAVSEMALQGGLLFVLLQSGLCPVFDAEAGQWQTLTSSSNSSSSNRHCLKVSRPLTQPVRTAAAASGASHSSWDIPKHRSYTTRQSGHTTAAAPSSAASTQ